MLVLTLVIMGVATFLIGLLPTYDAIGPWAAVAAGRCCASRRASASAANGAARC